MNGQEPPVAPRDRSDPGSDARAASGRNAGCESPRVDGGDVIDQDHSLVERDRSEGSAAKQVGKQLALPLVELPAGYNPRQMAHQIVTQMGSFAAVQS